MDELKMKTECISKDEARQFLINYHNINGSQNYCGYEGILNYFKKVGSIQYDPLNVVGRNADLVLQSKVTDYQPEMLQSLLYREHFLVDGFDKEMCIYLAEDFSRFERIRAANQIAVKNTLTYRNQLEALEILDEVRDCINKKGPIGTKDISIGENRTSRWGHKKLSSAALDYLYTIGELCVVNKNGTQKQFDYTANILPSEVNKEDDFTNDADFMCWYVKRRISSVGLLWDKNGGAWQGHFLSNKEKRNHTLDVLTDKGDLVQLYVENVKSTFYIRKESLYQFKSINSYNKVKFLAPLDNILWDREMVKQLFDFDYSWEVYTPQAKRKYGYYVLPVLYGDQLIARFEPEKVKKNAPFRIKNWWWEPKVKITFDLLDAIDSAINDFCRYLNVECEPSYSLALVPDHNDLSH